MDNDLALARLNPDGSLDTSFGQGGKVESDFGGYESINTITLQTDGKILAAGYVGTAEDNFIMARYLADGSLDTSFGSGGVQYTSFATDWTRPSGIAMQSDDKVVVGGAATVELGCIPQDPGPPLCEHEQYFALARYNVSLDCYALTVTVNPSNGGSVTADPPPNCGETHYDPGTVVELTATTNDGYAFGGWSGDADGSENPVEVTMDADRNVAAHFNALPVEGEMPIGEVEIEVGGGGPYTVEIHIEGHLPDACTRIDRVEQSRDGANVTVDVLTVRPGDTTCAQQAQPYSLDVTLDGTFTAGDYTLTLNGVPYDFSVP
jgi:uncharacterized delta-60 repeat protein/uncharacterized repeat protein (TIGR02543 family)